MKKLFSLIALVCLVILSFGCGGRAVLYGKVDTQQVPTKIVGYVHYNSEVFTFDKVAENGDKTTYRIVNSRGNFLQSSAVPGKVQSLRHYGQSTETVPLELTGWVNEETKSIMIQSFVETKITCKGPNCKVEAKKHNGYVRETNDATAAKTYKYQFNDELGSPLALLKTDAEQEKKLKDAFDNRDFSTLSYIETDTTDQGAGLPVWQMVDLGKTN